MGIKETKILKSPPDSKYTRIIGYSDTGLKVDADPFGVTKRPHSEVKSGNIFMFTSKANQICWLSDASGRKRVKIHPNDILLWKYIGGFEIRKLTQAQLDAFELF